MNAWIVSRIRAWRLARVMRKHGFTKGISYGNRKGWIEDFSLADSWVRLRKP